MVTIQLVPASTAAPPVVPAMLVLVVGVVVISGGVVPSVVSVVVVVVVYISVPHPSRQASFTVVNGNAPCGIGTKPF